MTEFAVIASEAAPLLTGTPVFVIHTLAHAVAAVTAAADANQPIMLLSAPGAGAGAGWFYAVISAARAAIPTARCTATLDCGGDAGAAQAAIRAGIKSIVFIGHPDIAARLVDIAQQSGTQLLPERPPALLDLQDAFFTDADTLHRHCTAALRDGQS